ncbi:MAG: AAA domain-containing protein [Planctomycetota bacterium]
MSLVRSNPKGEIGFLADVRRMDVAMEVYGQARH